MDKSMWYRMSRALGGVVGGDDDDKIAEEKEPGMNITRVYMGKPVNVPWYRGVRYAVRKGLENRVPMVERMVQDRDRGIDSITERDAIGNKSIATHKMMTGENRGGNGRGSFVHYAFPTVDYKDYEYQSGKLKEYTPDEANRLSESGAWNAAGEKVENRVYFESPRTAARFSGALGERNKAINVVDRNNAYYRDYKYTPENADPKKGSRIANFIKSMGF